MSGSIDRRSASDEDRRLSPCWWPDKWDRFAVQMERRNLDGMVRAVVPDFNGPIPVVGRALERIPLEREAGPWARCLAGERAAADRLALALEQSPAAMRTLQAAVYYGHSHQWKVWPPWRQFVAGGVDPDPWPESYRNCEFGPFEPVPSDQAIVRRVATDADRAAYREWERLGGLTDAQRRQLLDGSWDFAAEPPPHLTVRPPAPPVFDPAKIHLKKHLGGVMIANKQTLESVLGRPVTDEEWDAQRAENTRIWNRGAEVGASGDDSAREAQGGTLPLL